MPCAMQSPLATCKSLIVSSHFGKSTRICAIEFCSTRPDELGEQYAGRGGQRTIDLLHVALALECAADTFLSFDRRQRRLAEAVGLKVRP
jgi:hypothetical protein